MKIGMTRKRYAAKKKAKEDFKDHYLSCKACGIPWDKHKGIVHTCAENQALRAELALLKKIMSFKDPHDYNP
jgi:hypothetical protein